MCSRQAPPHLRWRRPLSPLPYPGRLLPLHSTHPTYQRTCPPLYPALAPPGSEPSLYTGPAPLIALPPRHGSPPTHGFNHSPSLPHRPDLAQPSAPLRRGPSVQPTLFPSSLAQTPNPSYLRKAHRSYPRSKPHGPYPTDLAPSPGSLSPPSSART